MRTMQPICLRRCARVVLGPLVLGGCAALENGLEPAHPDTLVSSHDSGDLGLADHYLCTLRSLYRLDAATWETSLVGTFPGVPWMFDIALSESGQMYGTDGDDLIAIDADTADITYLYGIGSTAALAALPDGRLVSAGLDGVFFIEPETGEKTLVAASSGYGLDGDVAVFPDGSVYWSASTPEGGYALLRVAPESAVATLIGPLDTDRAWGLLSVDERLVAVSGTGVVYEIDPTTAGSVMLAELPGYWVGAASKP